MLPFLPPYPAAEGVSVRVAFILHAAMVYVASRIRQAVPGMGGALIPVWVERRINGWIEQRRKAIVALIRRIEAGTQKPPRPYGPRAARPDAAGEPGPRTAPTLRLPSGFGWLCAVGREMRAPGEQLGMLLGDAGLEAMVTGHPRLAALLRPVLRMLGEPPPAWFPKAPTRVRRKRPARLRAPVAGDPASDSDPSRALARFIAAARARQYAADMARLYEGCGGPPPQIARRIAREAPRPPPAPAAAAPAAEVPVDRGKYYYAETWNGKLIPVRRRWG
jgi:hypothetical protein